MSFYPFILSLTFLPCPLLCLSTRKEEKKSLADSRADMEQQLASATSTVAILQTEKSKLQTEVQESKKEQDDLLMLLADQDQKIHSLIKRLKDVGETVDAQSALYFSLLITRYRSLNSCPLCYHPIVCRW